MNFKGKNSENLINKMSLDLDLLFNSNHDVTR